MLGKSKLETGHTMYSLELLKKWKSSPNEWGTFKAYLQRDCTLLIDIVHKLSELFFNYYDFILGTKSTISSTAQSIFFNIYYKPKKIFL